MSCATGFDDGGLVGGIVGCSSGFSDGEGGLVGERVGYDTDSAHNDGGLVGGKVGHAADSESVVTVTMVTARL